MEASATPTQNRLMARLVAAIYGIVDALVPIVGRIQNDPANPWQQRTRHAARFYRIIRELLALTAHIRPANLSAHPSFPAAPARPGPKAPSVSLPRCRPPAGLSQAGTTPGQAPAAIRILSARRIARHLADLLQQLLCLAMEVGAALPASIHRNLACARRIAGCDALPPPRPVGNAPADPRRMRTPAHDTRPPPGRSAPCALTPAYQLPRAALKGS